MCVLFRVRDRRSRRRGGEKEKQKEKAKEIIKDREKERTKKPTKEMEKTGEEKVKNKKDKGKEKGKEIPVAGDRKSNSEVTREKTLEVKEQIISALKEQDKDTINESKDEERKKRSQQVNVSAETTTAKEVEKREDLKETAVEEKDKSKPKALGISSSRLPNDEWIDPWQRTTSPKRHSVSSRSSRSRSSSSSSDSSRSSRSHSGSESRSTSRSASRSRSRSVSPTSSRSRSRSRSGSRSKSRSRSGSRSSGSDRSSSTSSNSPVKEVKTVHNEEDEEKGGTQASNVSSESESESNKSKSPSPKPVQKSPTKLKGSPELAPRTPPVESDRNKKEKRNRYEYGRADKIQKSYGTSWGRRAGVRSLEDPYRYNWRLLGNSACDRLLETLLTLKSHMFVFLRWLDSQEDLLLENQTELDNINIITLVAMNDDKHNDVWVSCFHGNSTGLGMVSHRVLFL